MKKSTVALLIAFILGCVAFLYFGRDLLRSLLSREKEEAIPEEDIFSDEDPESRLVEFPAEPEAREEKSQDRVRRGYIRLKFHERVPEAL